MRNGHPNTVFATGTLDWFKGIWARDLINFIHNRYGVGNNV